MVRVYCACNGVFLLEHECGYLQPPGGVGRVGFFAEEARRLGALVEQMLSGRTLSLGDVANLSTRQMRDYKKRNRE